MIPIHVLDGLKSIPHSNRTSVYIYLYNGSLPHPTPSACVFAISAKYRIFTSKVSKLCQGMFITDRQRGQEQYALYLSNREHEIEALIMNYISSRSNNLCIFIIYYIHVRVDFTNWNLFTEISPCIIMNFIVLFLPNPG